MIYRFAITERDKELEEEEEVTIKIMMALNGSVDQRRLLKLLYRRCSNRLQSA
jgi:hypothetical protein